MKKKILFICTHNSARSQIAEAFLNDQYGEHFEAFSAGTEPTTINPYVISVMSEVGIDIFENRVKNEQEFLDQEIDIVITLCDDAKATCPFFPGAKNYMHKSFPDPSEFTGMEEEILINVRHVRDEIKEWIQKTFGDLNGK